MAELKWPDDPAAQAIAVADELSRIGYDVKYGAPYGNTPAGLECWHDEKMACIRLVSRMHALTQRWQVAAGYRVTYRGPPPADPPATTQRVYATRYRSCYGATVAGFMEWAGEVEEMILLAGEIKVLEQRWANAALPPEGGGARDRQGIALAAQPDATECGRISGTAAGANDRLHPVLLRKRWRACLGESIF